MRIRNVGLVVGIVGMSFVATGQASAGWVLLGGALLTILGLPAGPDRRDRTTADRPDRCRAPVHRARAARCAGLADSRLKRCDTRPQAPAGTRGAGRTRTCALRIMSPLL